MYFASRVSQTANMWRHATFKLTHYVAFSSTWLLNHSSAPRLCHRQSCKQLSRGRNTTTVSPRLLLFFNSRNPGVITVLWHCFSFSFIGATTRHIYNVSLNRNTLKKTKQTKQNSWFQGKQVTGTQGIPMLFWSLLFFPLCAAICFSQLCTNVP